MDHLSRRSFISGLTALMGGALALSACDAAVDYKSGPKAKILSGDQLKMIELMADIIIPDTDTPGAATAGVHDFINHMVAKYMTDEEAEAFTNGLAVVDTSAGGFLSLSHDKQVAVVAALDENMKKERFYRIFKGLVVTGYYTSEIGATQELIYDPVPGPYHEVPLADIGRAWAT